MSDGCVGVPAAQRVGAAREMQTIMERSNTSLSRNEEASTSGQKEDGAALPPDVLLRLSLARRTLGVSLTNTGRWARRAVASIWTCRRSSAEKIEPGEEMSKKMVNTLLRNTHDLFHVCTLNGEHVYSSPAVEDVLGWEPADLERRA